MSYAAGSRLGPYEILSPIGEGGMGQVWKARDTRLDRIVAIKTSLTQFDERFEREARAVAALNHPHICQLYDVGPNYLVMELVEGHAIKGPLPLDQALTIAIQLADALDAAHKKGITHRDLKPANALMTKAGVKVLDFGLAKFETARGAAVGGDSVTRMATQQGTIVGTLQYMAPEQLQGKDTVDSRADIFSFGCVLYEMLTGKRAFDGDNPASIIAAVMERPAPSISDVAPVALDRVFRKCLAKDPDDRWQSARDLKDELQWIAGGGGTIESRPEPKPRPTLWMAIAAGSTLVLAALAFIHFREKPAELPIVRTSILPPPKTQFQYATPDAAPPALSPDGRLLVFGARSEDGHTQLYVRSLDSTTAQPLAGTDGASYPFWSPDSRHIGFAADGKLKKIDAAGGPAVALADAANFRGGTWSANGVIVFAPGISTALSEVSTGGGTPTPATTLSATPEGATTHRLPWFLPDGKHFLYMARTSVNQEGEIRIGSLDAGEHGVALAQPLGKTNSQVIYSQGYLLYVRDQTLMAQAFDAGHLRVTGDAAPLAEQVDAYLSTLYAPFTASSSGGLAYLTNDNDASRLQLAWFDRDGKRTALPADPGLLSRFHLSPDGRFAAVSATVSNNMDIWIYDLEHNLRTRFSFDPAAEVDAVWSPDGKTIVFDSDRKGHFDLYRKAVNGTGAEELLYADGSSKYPTSWSPDGKYLFYLSFARKFGIFVLPMEGARKPFSFGGTNFNELNAVFSPDGHWAAWQSNESGRYEIYLAAFPGPGGKRQVSVAGGTFPHWRSDGKELYYMAPGGELMAAEIGLAAADAKVGAVRPLFSGLLVGNGYQYDVSPDGQRFLAIAPPEQAGASKPLTLVQNWTAGLKK